MSSDSEDDDYTPEQEQQPDPESQSDGEVDDAELQTEIQELKAEEKDASKIDFTEAAVTWAQLTGSCPAGAVTSAPAAEFDIELDSSQHGLPLLFKSLAAKDKTPTTSKPSSRSMSPVPEDSRSPLKRRGASFN